MQAFDAAKARLRRKHDPTTKRRGALGHTVRRRYAHADDATLERSHEPCQLQQHGLIKGYALTAFEVEGLDVQNSVNRSNYWDAIRMIFAEHAIAPPIIRRAEDGMQVTTAQLPPLAEILPDPEAVAANYALNNVIYRITGDKKALRSNHGRRKGTAWAPSWRYRVKGLTVFAELPTGPPAVLTDAIGRGEHSEVPELLPMRLHCQSMRVSQSARVRSNCPAHAFDVAAARGYPLNIDLGRTCTVLAVATQGRHPSTRTYPQVVHDSRDGWLVEGHPEHDPCTRYKGPRYSVLEERRSGCSRGPFSEYAGQPMQWVSRYELLWRTEHGRAWNSLGTFTANEDATGEVAHVLDVPAGLSSGLVCRYLRIVPLETVGGGALRVGVYGRATPARAADEPRAARRSGGGGASSATGAEATSDGEIPSSVTYTLREPGEGFNPTLCNDGSRHACQCCRCSYCIPNSSASAARLERRLQAKAEACAWREL